MWCQLGGLLAVDELLGFVPCHVEGVSSNHLHPREFVAILVTNVKDVPADIGGSTQVMVKPL
jgi:hypothetical protein